MSQVKVGPKGYQKSITAWVDVEVVERLDVLAKKFGISKSQLLANIVVVNLPEIEALNNMGLFNAAVIWQDLKASLRAWAENAKMDPKSVGTCE